MDFKIKTNEAFCLFCGEDSEVSSKCIASIDIKTWGARNTINVETEIYYSEGPNREVVRTSDFTGGLITQLTESGEIASFIYFFLPWLALTITF